MKYTRWSLTLGLLAAICVLGTSRSGAEGLQTGATSFISVSRLTADASEWVAAYHDRVAFGAGTRLLVGRADPLVRITSSHELERSVTEAVLAGNRLYLNEGDRLSVVDLDRLRARAAPLELADPPRGAFRLARMDDYLVVAESGRGVHILELPVPGHGSMSVGHAHARHGDAHVLERVGFLALGEEVTAVAASTRLIYVLVESSELVVIDARDAGAPAVRRTMPFTAQARSLQANGSRLYAIAPNGLEILDVSGATTQSEGRFPEVHGEALYLSGRRVHVAAAASGLDSFYETSSAAATIDIDVGDNFFDPLDITVDAGDTIRWTKPGTIFTHNVQSCTAATSGCGGENATESFTSGAVTTAPFVFEHTFLSEGSNRYVCFTHRFSASMQGSVTVSATAVSPPGVPDGGGLTTPLTIGKGALNSLSINWDATTCPDADNYQLLVGGGSQLPTDLLGTYGVALSSVCSIGTTGSFNWFGSPDPSTDPSGYFWFLVVANDGAAAEGSWGANSGPQERNGPGVGGASDVCQPGKELSNTCGQ
jgi:plastocyanin